MNNIIHPGDYVENINDKTRGVVIIQNTNSYNVINFDKNDSEYEFGETIQVLNLTHDELMKDYKLLNRSNEIGFIVSSNK